MLEFEVHHEPYYVIHVILQSQISPVSIFCMHGKREKSDIIAQSLHSCKHLCKYKKKLEKRDMHII